MLIIAQTIALVTAIYLICYSLIMNTKNLQSAILFKVIPFFFGLGCLFAWFCWKGIII